MQFLADMNAEESYFLLLDDPAHFQLDYQALANWDGTPPGDNDYTAAGKTVPWQTARCWLDTTLERIRPPCWEPPLLAAAQNW